MLTYAKRPNRKYFFEPGYSEMRVPSTNQTNVQMAKRCTKSNIFVQLYLIQKLLNLAHKPYHSFTPCPNTNNKFSEDQKDHSHQKYQKIPLKRNATQTMPYLSLTCLRTVNSQKTKQTTMIRNRKRSL